MSSETTETIHDHSELAPLPLWLSLLLLSLMWVIIGALFSLQIIIVENVSTEFAVHVALMDWGPWILVSPVVLWFSRRVQISSSTWKWTLPSHLGACILIVVLLELFSQLVFIPRRPQPFPQRDMMPRNDMMAPRPPRELHAPPRMIHARFNLPVYWVLVAASHAIAYHRRSMERERRALRAEALLVEARLAALQAQINPHFLFNSLNAIAQLVDENPRVAEEMIESLSEMLRAVMSAANRREVSLLEELTFVDRYLSIQQIRFEDRLTVQRDITEDALKAIVPTLILQPLVENAIIHGITPQKAPGTITIKAWVDGSQLHVRISDTGSGTSSPVGQPLTLKEGLGLSNTRARLEASYGSHFQFSLTHAPEGGVCTHLAIPYTG